VVVSWRHISGFFLAICLAGSLGGTVAHAEPVADAAGPSVVQIVVTGEAHTTSALEQLVRELVAELPVQLEWSGSRAIDPRQVLARHADERRVLVRAWVDLSDAKRAKIYVANGDSERFIVRFVPEPNGYDAVAREALGQIVESSIAAFVARDDAGISREDAVQKVADEDPVSVGVVAPPPPEPRAQPRPRSVREAPSPRLDLGLVYQGALLDSSKTLQHGGALILEASFAAASGPSFVLRAGVGYRAKARLDDEKIGLRLSAETARLAAGLEGDATRRLALGALLGGGLDVVSVEPVARSAATRAHASARNVEPFLLLMGTAKLRLTSALALQLALGTELDLSHPAYGVEGANGLTPVFTPWLVRPTVMLGLFTGFGGRHREIE
jgi:hypothetical protein